MKNTFKDRRDKRLRRFYKELCDTDFSDETYKKYGLTKQDMHSAIRMTSSVKGPADCSRSAYKHDVQITIQKGLANVEQRELREEIEYQREIREVA